MNRPNWYRDHPDACTCVACDLERKTASKIRDSGKSVVMRHVHVKVERNIKNVMVDEWINMI